MSDPELPRIELAILAKAPVPGLAKTRLIPHLGGDGAASLQRWLLQRTVAAALVADIGPVSLWCAPDERHPDFLRCRAFGPLRLCRQPATGLGERMLAAVSASATEAGTLVIGTDCAVLSPGRIRAAAQQLREHDAVVVPAEDGGYVLIGLRRAEPRVFEHIDWSSDRVMRQTRARLAELGLHWVETAPLWDVDRAEDFERLARRVPDIRCIVGAGRAS